MAWKVHDFNCSDCNSNFEALVDKDQRLEPCPDCGQPCERIMSAPTLGLYSMASPEQKKDMLRKRSEEDTYKQVAKTPERWGMAGKSSPWNVRSTKSAKKSKTTKSKTK